MRFLKRASSFLNNLKSSNSDGGNLISSIGGVLSKISLVHIGLAAAPIIIIVISFLTIFSLFNYKVNLMQMVDTKTNKSDSSSSPTGTHQAIVDAALTQLGVKYSYTGSYYCPKDGNDSRCTDEGPGFNCSGLAKWAYKQAGFDISDCQGYQNCGEGSQTYIIHSKGNWKTDINDCSAGDLVFFSKSGDWQNTYHVGIYMGNGEMVHADGTEVAVSGYNNSGNFVGCGWPA